MKLKTLFSAIVKVDHLISQMIRNPEKYHWSQYERRVYQQQFFIDAMFKRLSETQMQLATKRTVKLYCPNCKEFRDWNANQNDCVCDECAWIIVSWKP